MEIIGRLGTEDGYQLRFELDEDRLSCQIGGSVLRKKLEVEINETGVFGKVTGNNGFSVDLKLESGGLVGTIGDQNVVLRGVDQVNGQIGDGLWAASVVAQTKGQRLFGRIGNVNFEFALQGAPGWIIALGTVVAYQALFGQTVSA